MGPERLARRLERVRDNIDTAWRLTEAGHMALHQLDELERSALGELLNAIQDKPTAAVAALEAETGGGLCRVAPPSCAA